MILSILQPVLKAVLITALPAVAGKSTLPILANVLLTANDAGLSIAATNLEIGITTTTPARVEAHGAVTVPARLLTDVVGNLPNDLVTLTIDNRTQAVKVQCGRFTSNINGIDADEFPTIPTGAAEGAVTLPAATMREAIQLTAFAAATDNNRPVLAGVLLGIVSGSLTMAAADGFRLSTVTRPVESDATMSMIVPARALDALTPILANAEDVSISLAPGGQQVAFRVGTTELVSRLIDGQFPDVARIIPQARTTRAVATVADLTKAVKVASYFAKDSQNVLDIRFGVDSLSIAANAAETGDSDGCVDATVSGPESDVRLNSRYVAEALASIPTQQAAIETQGPTSAAVFRPVGLDGYVHLIMPMSKR